MNTFPSIVELESPYVAGFTGKTLTDKKGFLLYPPYYKELRERYKRKVKANRTRTIGLD
jgi:hypothetical protein